MIVDKQHAEVTAEPVRGGPGKGATRARRALGSRVPVALRPVSMSRPAENGAVSWLNR